MRWSLLILVLNLALALDISSINLQSYTLIDHMKRIEEFPQLVEGKKVREWILEDKLPEGRLFLEKAPLTKEGFQELFKNSNLERLSELIHVVYGWTLRRTNMRMYPSHLTIHRGDPQIDYNQYTLLEPFTPLAILHTSKDGRWFYVHAPYMRGWVQKEDVRVVSKESLLKVKSLPFLVVTTGRVKLGGVVFGLGSKMPYLERRGQSYKVLLPDGTNLWITKERGLEEGYMKFEEARVRSLLEELLGTPYDWGGKEGRWDCSSLVQSLYSVFGVELPRNSAQQERIGRVVARGFESYEELKNLLKVMPSFRTLLFMRGHVMIYGGFEGDDVVVYHSVYRMTREDGNKWFLGAISKNYLEREKLRNIYKAIVSVNLLD